DGLIEPIVVRPVNGHYETIAGGRRVEAIREYTGIKAIPARIVNADDLQARRISAAENLQREDLSAIETIEAIVEIVDAELIEDKEYASMGKKPAERMKSLLGKPHSISISKKRASEVSNKADLLFNKFIKQVKKIFKNLPKSLEWQSFYANDLPFAIDFCKEELYEEYS
ncbi:MAG: ParB N-terminal domain-containing protein, partial [Deltaproteobacteria bacterium]|nr:ParB N-terminal domain-containing protein [Deltaproteobacteria bacterium]